MCLDATVSLRSATGARSLAIAELLTGPGSTVAEPGELLVAIDIPTLAAGTGSAYVRLKYRRQMEIAVVGATAALTLDGDTVARARIAITALSPTIQRVPEAEAALEGTTATAEVVAVAAREAADAATPISDVRASERYRRAMAAVIARRAIDAALTRAAVARSRSRPAGVSRESRDHALGQRHLVPGRARSRHDAAGRGSGSDRADRCEGRLRRLRMRRLHDAARREAAEQLSYLALQAEGSEVTTVEGLSSDGELQPAPGGLPRARRRPVRLLHAGHADLGNRTPRGEPDPVRGRGADRALREPLPLHRLRRIVKAVLAVAGSP